MSLISGHFFPEYQPVSKICSSQSEQNAFNVINPNGPYRIVAVRHVKFSFGESFDFMDHWFDKPEWALYSSRVLSGGWIYQGCMLNETIFPGVWTPRRWPVSLLDDLM